MCYFTCVVAGKIKRWALSCLVFFTAVSFAWARLGDRDDVIEDLYGKIVDRHLRDDGKVSVLYHKDRYYYVVLFDRGRSIMERYFHAKRTPFSEKEIARFLKANAAGATWIPDNKSKERRFERSDRRAEATYGQTDDGPALTVRAVLK